MSKLAPGFQTNVGKVRVTPAIRARLDRGENVSPAEIAEASAKADLEAVSTKAQPKPVREFIEVNESQGTSGYTTLSRDNKSGNVDTEWLPDSITQTKKRSKGKRK